MKALQGTWESSRAWLELYPIIAKLLPLLSARKSEDVPHAFRVDSSNLEILRGHHLLPLIFREVARRGLEGELPAAVSDELRKAYILALQVAARQEAEIAQVLRALDQAGLEAIILKGADVRHRLYDDPAVRPIGDLDLLISRQKFLAAKKILIQLGYLPLPEPRPGFVERFENEILFRPVPGKCLKIDLHFDELRSLGPVYRLPYPPLAARAQTMDLAGLQAKVLAPEHALIHLSLHAFSDFTIYGPFATQLIDLCLALSRLSLDWQFFLEELVRFRCQGPVYLIVRTMASLPGLEVPAAVLAILGQYRPSWQERLIIQRLAYLAVHLSMLYRHRRFSDWAFFFYAKLWPQESYTREHFGSASARLRIFLSRMSSIKFAPFDRDQG
jgi:hypothetical protein